MGYVIVSGVIQAAETASPWDRKCNFHYTCENRSPINSTVSSRLRNHYNCSCEKKAATNSRNFSREFCQNWGSSKYLILRNTHIVLYRHNPASGHEAKKEQITSSDTNVYKDTKLSLSVSVWSTSTSHRSVLGIPHPIRERCNQVSFRIIVWGATVSDTAVGPYLLFNRMTGERQVDLLGTVLLDCLNTHL